MTLYQHSIRTEWSIEHRGDGSYVTERFTKSGHKMTFGPMSRDAVGPFIDERIEMIEDSKQAALAKIRASHA